ncbi:hypothetical protein [Paraliobacillus sediminis]|uniref:hypothetical protein n=1 Tax=Paraliobacillus sediminis TaxID=1885916 RepID=UPI000E3D3EF4|nr:hypothetical protein [Paraliobacillus sediminis]
MNKVYLKQKIFISGGNFTINAKDEVERDKYVIKGSFLFIPILIITFLSIIGFLSASHFYFKREK